MSALESSKTEENINELAKIVEKLHNFEMSRANKQALKISYDRGKKCYFKMNFLI